MSKIRLKEVKEMGVEADVIALGERYWFEQHSDDSEQALIIQRGLDYGKSFELFEYGNLKVDEMGQPADELTRGFFERYGLRYNPSDQRIEVIAVDQETYRRENEEHNRLIDEHRRASTKPDLWKKFAQLVVHIDKEGLDRVTSGIGEYAVHYAGPDNAPWMFGQLIEHAVELAFQETGVEAPANSEQA